MAFTIFSLTSTSSFSDNVALLRRYRYFRLFLYFSNLIIFSLGIACLATASSYLTSRAATLLTTQLAVGAIVLGIFAIVLAVWGFVAAFKEAKYGLVVYLMVVAPVAVSLLGVGVAVAVQYKNAGSIIVSAWEDLYTQHDWNTLNAVQQAFSCCGLFNYSDSWTPTYLYYYAPANLVLNITLCPGSGINLDTHTHQDLHPSLSSCYSAIYSLYSQNVAAAAGVGIALSLLLLGTVGVSVSTIRAIAKMQKEEVEKRERHTESGDEKSIGATREVHVEEQRLRDHEQEHEQAEIVVDGGQRNGHDEESVGADR